MALLTLIPHDTKINFIGFRFISFAFTIAIMLSAVVGIAFKGLNYGIDFKGGFILEVRMNQEPDLNQLRSSLEGLGMGEVTIQQFGDAKDLLIRMEKQEGDDATQSHALGKIKQVLGSGVDYRRVETVGPKVGGELVQNAIKAVSFALIAMLIYIALRFEWQFSVCAIIALLHDCLAIFSLFSWSPLEFNETAIIAILITAGYSINDTIVIFDRIRENTRKYKRMPISQLINRSINETLSRTILTVSTTLLALTALYLFGGKVISTFSLPIIIGVIVGSFSSICLAAPLLFYLNPKALVDGRDADAGDKLAANQI